MSRLLIAFCAIFAVASAAEWKDLMTPDKIVEVNQKIGEVVGQCIAGSAMTVESVTIELERNIEDISRDAACAVECFLVNGPGVMDKYTGEITIPSYFPDEVRPTIEKCAADLNAQNIADRCIKALTFKKTCMPTFYEYQKNTVAADSEWQDFLTADKIDAMNQKIGEVVGKCVAGTPLTVEAVTLALEKDLEDISRDVACAVECFMINGPGVIDSVTGKIRVPSYFPDAVRPIIVNCAAQVEAQQIADRCIKALTFKKNCMDTFHEHQENTIAADSEWQDFLTADKIDAMNQKIGEVVGKCVAGTPLTVEAVTLELEKDLEDISREVACAVECFMINGPGVIDSVTGKIRVPSYFPEAVRPIIVNCAAHVEAQQIADRCMKALTFKKNCMDTFHTYQENNV